MNLVRIGFLYLTLFAFVDGFILPPGGGFGGFSGMFSILLIILFIAALAQQNKNLCPANYTLTPNDPSSCIRFFTNPPKDFDNARAVCVRDGGNLLELNTATFPLIQKLAQNNGGMCSYWVGATEEVDGTWEALNGDPIPTTSGIFFFDNSNGFYDDGGLMSNADSFLLLGENENEEHCYICQKDI